MASVSEASCVSSGIGRCYVSTGGISWRCLRYQKQTHSEMRMEIPLQRLVLCTNCDCRSQEVASCVDVMNIRSMALLLYSGAPTGTVEKVHTKEGYDIEG